MSYEEEDTCWRRVQLALLPLNITCVLLLIWHVSSSCSYDMCPPPALVPLNICNTHLTCVIMYIVRVCVCVVCVVCVCIQWQPRKPHARPRSVCTCVCVCVCVMCVCV